MSVFRCIILDELGDTTDDEVRKQCFDELDEDDSNAIDFEEYLMVSLLVDVFIKTDRIILSFMQGIMLSFYVQLIAHLIEKVSYFFK